MPADTRTDDERRTEEERRMIGVPEQRTEGFERIEFRDLTADELQDATVYDRMNERVSGISDVVLSTDGTQVNYVLIDVGGFLGLFTRTVAVDIDQLDIQTDPQRNDVRVYLNMTQDEHEALPEHER